MLDIKKNLILISLFLSPLTSYAQIGCIDDDYVKIESAKTKTNGNTLVLQFKALGLNFPLDLEKEVDQGVLKVRIYGTYIIQDHIQVSKRVSLLEYAGFTQINVVGGRDVLKVKRTGENIFILYIKI